MTSITKSQIEKIFPKDGQKSCQFVLGAHNSTQFPETNYKEFAFIGASNVGKSSLINALTSQKIAIVSNTPGRTRQVNFFLLSERLMLVDMPGYGFAKARDKDIVQWQKTSFQYFSSRAQLKRIFLLIDPIKGIKESDLDIINIFNSVGVSFQIVLTKCDKLKPQAVELVKNEIASKAAKWPAMHPHIILSSSKHDDGVSEIQREIAELFYQ